MTYFDSGDLTCLDLDLYLVNQEGRIGRLATLGCNIFPELLTQAVHDIINYYFHCLAEKRSKYTELFRVLAENVPEAIKEKYYRDAEIGLYCFDRGKDEATSRSYRLVLVPENPLHIDDIPEPTAKTRQECAKILSRKILSIPSSFPSQRMSIEALNGVVEQFMEKSRINRSGRRRIVAEKARNSILRRSNHDTDDKNAWKKSKRENW